MKTSRNMKSKFSLGTIFLTAGARALAEEKLLLPRFFLKLHQCGCWGFIRQYDRENNEQSLTSKRTGRIFSSYNLTNSTTKIWIFTDLVNKTSTLMLPQEY